MNVLFIVSDDLRPQLNAFRGPYYPNPKSTLRMYTPYLDTLAKNSLVLTRAYVQYSMCAPSRSSYMTGRRPDTIHVWDLNTYWRRSAGNFSTLPQYLMEEHGYLTTGLGKIFHPGKYSAPHKDKYSWSIPPLDILNGIYWGSNRFHNISSWRAVTVQERQQMPLPDEDTQQKALEYLRQFAAKGRTGEQPFFLAVGYQKPHLPLVCPEEFWKYYPSERMDLAERKHLPSGYPKEGYYPSSEYLKYRDIGDLDMTGKMNETLPDAAARELRRAYFACVSFVDSLVGGLLQELERLRLVNNTVIIFIGDHGFHLGENSFWGKHTNFELGTRAPLMLRIPGRTDRGIVSHSLVEFVDLFPTIVDGLGLGMLPHCPKDSSAVVLCSDGTSFKHLIDEPRATHKTEVYTQLKGVSKAVQGMHYSIFDGSYRYTEHVRITLRYPDAGTEHDWDIDWNNTLAAELYDLNADWAETVNVINDSVYWRVRKNMSKKLREFVGNEILNTTDLYWW
ncbi:hypothetical protein LSH36_294g02017 [Paralvinella palmiformis]|uniref:Sulfatase N-terminal domain-containing protein n=1 Tax=Paralvinella palmiformis TaxID=53620 RepID=A0AAD9JIV2_9ANNE|nr:hypothetical protein LSH36_294g02017 [Paralvinella palmiformis]